MTDNWDGRTERRESMKQLHREIMENTFELRCMRQQIDNELGSANHPEAEGSVKRHIRKLQQNIEKVEDKVEQMHEVIVGDGKDLPGLASKYSNIDSKLNSHIYYYRWLNGGIILGQLGLLWKMFLG